MTLILAVYFGCVYLVFIKWKLLPLNRTTKGLIALVGVTIATLFFVALQTITPASTRGMIAALITEIAPLVQGRVIEVPADVNQAVDPNEVLFRLDPQPYQARVDQLTGLLVQTEAGVAQLKESFDAARAQVRGVDAQLDLGRARLDELERLRATGAGSRFDVENKRTEVTGLEQQLLAAQAQENQARVALNARVGDRQSEVAQVLAQLDAAQFDLENCEVRAPAKGYVTMNALRPGMVIPAGRAVMTFTYTDAVAIAGLFPQKALLNIRQGDKAMITFPALPGMLFESTVRRIPRAIGNAQVVASGQLYAVGESRMTTLYPVFIELPEDFPADHVRLGLAASIRIHAEGAGVVGLYATLGQWIQTSLAYVS